LPVGYDPPMRARALLGAVPRPIKRRLTWLLGWVYWALRRLRALRARGLPSVSAPATADVAVDSNGELDAVLPADAPPSVLARNEHGLYCVPRSSQHRPVSRAILESRVWESETLELLCGADSAGDIVHAGTFFGDFVPALSHSRAGGARVWAFEPGDENYRCTRITVELNALENVTLSNAGLGASGGSALLATGDREGVALGGASRVITDPARARWFASEQVELVTIDDAVGEERRVAAIQLDVEGHEQEALAGALRTIERCRPLIVLETLPNDDWSEANLAPLGYKVSGQVNRNFILRCD
jgi:FkbM family methyltransferase